MIELQQEQEPETPNPVSSFLSPHRLDRLFNKPIVILIVLLHEVLIDLLYVLFVLAESESYKKKRTNAFVHMSNSSLTISQPRLSSSLSALNWLLFDWRSIILVALCVRWYLILSSLLKARTQGRVCNMSMYRRDTLMRRYIKAILEKNRVSWWSKRPVIVISIPYSFFFVK